MAAALITVADAVKTLLTTTVTSNGGTISRAYIPRLKLEDGEDLRVTVVPRKQDRERAARKTIYLDHTIDVGIQQRTPNASSDADTKMEFAETVAAYLEDNELPSATGARLLTVELLVAYDAKQLDELGQFTSVVRAIYRTGRQGS